MNYDDWERGCAADSVRNEFLVPQIVDFLSRVRPESILDVGCLTGYMPRQIDADLPYSPLWTLLDCDAEAVEYAKTRIPAGMNARLVNLSFDDFNPSDGFDAVLLTFTLLEFSDRTGLFDACARVLENGYLVVALPDCLIDVIAEAQSKVGSNVLEDFVRSDVALPKIDKFTAKPYPFVAVRMTRIIAEALAAGFVMISLIRYDSGDGGVFLIYFQRIPAHD